MKFSFLRFRHAAAMGLAALGLAAIGGLDARAQSFPYGREVLLDVNPMRGSKKVPSLDIGDGGAAEIELWCNTAKAQLIVAGNTITVILGPTSTRVCAPDVMRADDDLVAALNQVTNWRMENDALVLTGASGGRTLRFRIQTN
jgi:heat shock protein HslJ